ncbi:MAG: serine hydrolase domain-containing protein [Armatimonadota bacterium]
MPTSAECDDTVSLRLCTRRDFLRTCLHGGAGLLAATLVGVPAFAQAGGNTTAAQAMTEGIPIAGLIAEELTALDGVVLGIMKRHAIPCASLAVSKDGKVVAKRAYGYAEPAHTRPLQTDALFRIASCDKMLMASAVDRLAAEGWTVQGTGETFDRDLRIFRSMKAVGFIGPELTNVDPRLYDVTIGQMVDHKSGIAVLYPPVGDVQAFLKLDRLPKQSEVIKWHINQKLTADPGSKGASYYNNTAYGMLYGIVEWLTGSTMVYIRDHVLETAGSTEIDLSRTRPSDRNPKEVWYSTLNTGVSIFPEDAGARLPTTDGGTVSWDDTLIFSAEALVRYLSKWYIGTGKPLLDDKGQLASGLDNGFGIYYGEYVGTLTTMFQRRWTMCNAALLFNQNEGPPGVAAEDIAKPLLDVLEKTGW